MKLKLKMSVGGGVPASVRPSKNFGKITTLKDGIGPAAVIQMRHLSDAAFQHGLIEVSRLGIENHSVFQSIQRFAFVDNGIHQ